MNENQSPATPDTNETYVTVKEAAIILGVTEVFVRTMIKRGILDAVRVGPKLIRIKQSSLYSYLELNQQVGDAVAESATPKPTSGKAKKKRKKRENWGAIRQLPSGRYRATYVGLDNKRYAASHTFETITEARGWLAIRRVEVESGKWNAIEAHAATRMGGARAIVFSEYAHDWIDNRTNARGRHLAARTEDGYRRLIDGPLKQFANERLSAITAATVRAWFNERLETGKDTQTARAYDFLRAVMNTALQDTILSINPCQIRGAANISSNQRVLPPTKDELDRIMAVIDERFRAAVVLGAWAAMRNGEVRELRRKDITVTPDLVTDYRIVISITRSVAYTASTGYQVGPPKSEAGIRDVVLPPHVNRFIIEHLEKHTAEDEDALLFPPATGKSSHMAVSSFYDYWYPAREAAGRPDLHFHALRHFGATMYARTGATTKEIQARLGHATIDAAMRYQHATTDRDAELALRMSETLDIRTTTEGPDPQPETDSHQDGL